MGNNSLLGGVPRLTCPRCGAVRQGADDYCDKCAVVVAKEDEARREAARLKAEADG